MTYKDLYTVSQGRASISASLGKCKDESMNQWNTDKKKTFYIDGPTNLQIYENSNIWQNFIFQKKFVQKKIFNLNQTKKLLTL